MLTDIEGLKIRVQPNPVHLAAFKALGVNPTPIPWPELFTSLQQGVVDGAGNPLDNITMARLYEPQKHLALTGHAFELVCYLTGEKFFKILPANIQMAWEESMAAATEFQHQDLIRSDKKAVEFLKDGRMEITELSQQELDLFRDKVKPSWKVSKDLAGEEYFNKVIEGVAKVEKQVLNK